MKNDDFILTAEEFFDRLDRWMRNAQRFCIAATLVAFGVIVYLVLTGGFK